MTVLTSDRRPVAGDVLRKATQGRQDRKTPKWKLLTARALTLSTHASLEMILVIFIIFLTSCDGVPSKAESGAHGLLTTEPVAPVAARGPLEVLSSNPRYFTDGTGRAVYLTGSHHWNNLTDYDEDPTFDYGAYLSFLQSHNHNVIRLWAVETTFSAAAPWFTSRPFRYQRTGPGVAVDGGPKFDLTKFDPAYFDRLRSRVVQAQEGGIYAIVMLFQGFSVHNKGGRRINPWPGHPFHAQNNINGIDGDLDGNGEGEEVHTLQVPEVTRLQEAYVQKVLDTLNDLDNVIYEISNESHPDSVEWQYHMIHFIHTYEKTKPKQHPVLMSYLWGGHNWGGRGDNYKKDHEELFASPADAIAPGQGPKGEYMKDPPAADGRKVIISDTDHLWGVGGDEDWVWKSFMRGLNPIFMDPIEDPKWDSSRKAMGQTLTLANRIDLASMVPRTDLASTGYCLASPGAEYLVYLPPDSHRVESRLKSWMRSTRFVWRFANAAENLRTILRLSVDVDLSETPETLRITWFDPSTGEFIPAGETEGGKNRSFTAPFSGPAVLYLASQ